MSAPRNWYPDFVNFVLNGRRTGARSLRVLPWLPAMIVSGVTQPWILTDFLRT